MESSYALHLAIAALVGASFAAASACYMHRKTLDQLLRFARSLDRDHRCRARLLPDGDAHEYEATEGEDEDEPPPAPRDHDCLTLPITPGIPPLHTGREGTPLHLHRQHQHQHQHQVKNGNPSMEAAARSVGAGFGTRLSSLEAGRSSPRVVREEMARCFDLVRRLGRGAVYLGSSRAAPHHPHYLQTAELAREIARLLDCTTWSGAGPGLMHAATQGALEAQRPVGGFKILAGEWTTSSVHPYLPPESYLTCRFFSARKHGMMDAAVRSKPTDRTVVVALPGGIGTLDELFEMALLQQESVGSAHPVPFLLLNYDSYYSKLLDFLNDCQEWGTLVPGTVASLWKACSGNYEALEYLAEFYNIPAARRNYHLSPQLKPHKTPYLQDDDASSSQDSWYNKHLALHSSSRGVLRTFLLAMDATFRRINIFNNNLLLHTHICISDRFRVELMNANILCIKPAQF